MVKETLGGKRLGSGKKMDIHLRDYERSTHDLGYPFRTTMSSGTLVPFLVKVLTPGTTYDIGLNCEVMTHPTIGPLFGSYKVQLDVFSIPIRLYNAKLQLNQTNIGKNMESVLLPQVSLTARNIFDNAENLDYAQVNPSCILSYLGIRGLGHGDSGNLTVKRKFNVTPWIMYMDIARQYYLNKQEKEAYIIHNNLSVINGLVNDDSSWYNIVVGSAFQDLELNQVATSPTGNVPSTVIGGHTSDSTTVKINVSLATAGDVLIEEDLQRFYVWYSELLPIQEIFNEFEITEGGNNVWTIECRKPKYIGGHREFGNVVYMNVNALDGNRIEPRLAPFDINTIDELKADIYRQNLDEAEFVIGTGEGQVTYGNLTGVVNTAVQDGKFITSATSNQEGLIVKTYQSDLFNNWLDSEYIEGSNGINEITRIGEGTGGFTLNEFNVKSKIYNFLNRVAVTDGSRQSYIEVAYSQYGLNEITGPVYEGGLSKELVFQEVISNSASTQGGEEQPLGTLAGRGVMSKKHKGGKVRVKVEEESYVIGLVSITPRIDYSQGNDWSVNLKNIGELHKPAMDGIGFQDLITDQMAYWDTRIDNDEEVHFRSAGKQPSWINYQTSVPVTRGNFAIENDQMWMTLNRRYEWDRSGGQFKIKDLTTYIDPKKFNNIFADTRRDAQNFWVHIGVDIEARMKMSANNIPSV